MPTPREGETRDDWIDRCMGDEESVNDFPDMDQRYAFCVSRFDDKDQAPKKANMMMEYKHADFEIKELGRDGEVMGYASVFGNIDQGGDVVDSAAFDDFLSQMGAGRKKPKMLWQHNPHKVIGVWDELKKDGHGLMAKGRVLTEVQLGSEALTLMRAGAIDGLSIGYVTKEDDYINTDRGAVRKIMKADLWEVSVVTFPMNPEAVVTDVKNVRNKGEVERILRDAGVPGKFAKLVAIHGYDGAIKCLTDEHRDGDDVKARAQAEEQLAALQKSLKALQETFHAQR